MQMLHSLHNSHLNNSTKVGCVIRDTMLCIISITDSRVSFLHHHIHAHTYTLVKTHITDSQNPTDLSKTCTRMLPSLNETFRIYPTHFHQKHR